MGTRQRFAIPDGWVARGVRFEVQPTPPSSRTDRAELSAPSVRLQLQDPRRVRLRHVMPILLMADWTLMTELVDCY
jgi:hypothetical protein